MSNLTTDIFGEPRVLVVARRWAKEAAAEQMWRDALAASPAMLDEIDRGRALLATPAPEQIGVSR